MTETEVPGWLTALDENKPHAEVLNDAKLPNTTSYDPFRGALKARVSFQLAEWAGDRGIVALRVRFYFPHTDGTWSSFVPNACFMSSTRFPEIASGVTSFVPLIAPDIVVEVLSPDDPAPRMRRKIETYLEFGSSVVLVLEPEKRRVTLSRISGVEELDARGAWSVAPFDGLVFDWDEIYHEIDRAG